MRIETLQIEQHNAAYALQHRQGFDYIRTLLPDAETIVARLMKFQIALPSWGLGAGGTRFGRFAVGGEPRSLEEKIADAALVHQLSRACGSVSLHIPWDTFSDAAQLQALAAACGLQIDAMNSNTFQDQPGQAYSYRFGSLQHTDPGVRRQAVEHHLEVIRQGVALGSDVLSIWLADGSSFPGQLNFASAFRNTLESLEEIYSALPANWKVFIEYKAFEPNFYSTTVADWGQSLLFCRKLGPKAFTLVDLGHHLPNANIEQIVALLLMEGKLGGFHFNDSKYGDDDLTAGSIRPYQLFLIFEALVSGMDEQGMDHATALRWMIDASHNIKDPLEDLLQSLEAIRIAYAQALLVDREALARARLSNDVVCCQEILQQAYRTDVRPLVREARMRSGGAAVPLQLYRELGIRTRLTLLRGGIPAAE